MAQHSNVHAPIMHQVLTVIVDGVSKISGAATHACLNLIDLAGSERLKSSKAEGMRHRTFPAWSDNMVGECRMPSVAGL